MIHEILTFEVLCDHKFTGKNSICPTSYYDPNHLTEAEAQRGAAREGWEVGDKHYCPKHATNARKETA